MKQTNQNSSKIIYIYAIKCLFAQYVCAWCIFMHNTSLAYQHANLCTLCEEVKNAIYMMQRAECSKSVIEVSFQMLLM